MLPAPLVLFPSNPLHPTTPDSAFEEEARHAASAGFDVGFIDLEVFLGGDVKLRRVPEGPGEVIYRGWLLGLDAYRCMSEVVAARGRRLITEPAAYQHCYHLPEWYETIGGAEHTARSIWIPGSTFDLEAVVVHVREAFGSGAVILKDYVKSRKHEWFDACFIPAADDEANVRRVVGNFLRLQDDHVVGGLVFREFVALRRIGLHPKSRLPLVNEHRFFVLDGRPFYSAPYWADGDYPGEPPSADVLAPVLGRVRSRFYAADVAEKEGGGWMLVELNDGGSAGIPEGGAADAFYRHLRAALG
ncbi:ATP-grasp domain-containing protein [Sorangium sp. So ce128]|uniref:ATP-grasp domain-containing protein n=1 Tax=Sorangium sp. So ce128 TaxID=3133281 RepID=UPI003F61BC22